MKQIALSFLIVSWLGAATQSNLSERARPYLEAARAAGDAFVVVSSASGMPNLAPGALATAMGPNLAAGSSGVTLQVVDNTGAVRIAPPLFVSASQINFQIPANTPPGPVTFNVVAGSGNPLGSSGSIQSVAPALFTANESGLGVVAATAYRKVIPTQITSPVQLYDCPSGPGSCVEVPINLGVDAPVYLVLYATGLRGRSSDAAVTVTVGNQQAPVQSITPGDDNSSPGIDQVTVALPITLRGSGEVDVVLSVDGKTSNAGKINIQ